MNTQMKLPRFRFISGFIVASLIFGFSAFAVNVNNTPQGGYLVCVNNKTRVMTYPGTLKCPSGHSQIEIPGISNINSDSNTNTASTNKNNSDGSTNTSGNKNCNLPYLQKNPNQINEIVSQCSSSDLNKPQMDINQNEIDTQNKVNLAQQKLDDLRKKAKELSGTAGATAASDAVALQASLVAELIATTQKNLTIITAIVNAIAKKVKG